MTGGVDSVIDEATGGAGSIIDQVTEGVVDGWDAATQIGDNVFERVTCALRISRFLFF